MPFNNKTEVQKSEVIDYVNKNVGKNGGDDTKSFLIRRIHSSLSCYSADGNYEDITSLHLINRCKIAVDHIYFPFGLQSCWISVIDISCRLRKLGGPKAVYENTGYDDQTKEWYKRVDCLINEFDNIDLVAQPLIIEEDSSGYEIIDGCHRVLAKILKDGTDFKFKVFILKH